jgi:hypothetical protein
VTVPLLRDRWFESISLQRRVCCELVAAWILWTALSAVIDEKMPPPAAPGDEDEIPGSASRVDTLLPLVRNTLRVLRGSMLAWRIQRFATITGRTHGR